MLFISQYTSRNILRSKGFREIKFEIIFVYSLTVSRTQKKNIKCSEWFLKVNTYLLSLLSTSASLQSG